MSLELDWYNDVDEAGETVAHTGWGEYTCNVAKNKAGNYVAYVTGSLITPYQWWTTDTDLCDALDTVEPWFIDEAKKHSTELQDKIDDLMTHDRAGLCRWLLTLEFDIQEKDALIKKLEYKVGEPLKILPYIINERREFESHNHLQPTVIELSSYEMRVLSRELEEKGHIVPMVQPFDKECESMIFGMKIDIIKSIN